DEILLDLIDATNLHYGIAPTPALEELIDAVNAAIQPFKRIVARRHKHSHASSGGADNGDNNLVDEETQAPDTTLPPAPDLPPQAPDTGMPPINPDDLNPPAAGE
ncbi:MAG: hypothetical protein LBD28_00105, partial [Tannerellaceae bacterium]|nr:hypothetical protein [Tannerellaceae bacterium]